MIKKSIIIMMVSFSLIVASSVSYATLLTSDAGYTGPFLDLTSQANGSYNFTFGPVSLPGGIIFTAAPGPGYFDSNLADTGGNSGNGSVLGQGAYSLAGNGSFGGDAVYAGLDSRSGYMRFMLANPVSEFGLYLNYVPGNVGPSAGYYPWGPSDPIIAVLDNADNVIESYHLADVAPISTPNAFNSFAFRGIELNSASIYGFQLENSYILAAATDNGSPSRVPEPSSLILIGSGLTSIVFLRKWFLR